MTPDTDPLDGHIVLPRRASFWAAASVIAALAGQLVWAGMYVAKIDARFEAIDTRFTALSENDSRILKRGDDRYGQILARIESLERDRSIERDRLVRLEEQVRVSNDLLREIRQDIRGRR